MKNYLILLSLLAILSAMVTCPMKRSGNSLKPTPTKKIHIHTFTCPQPNKPQRIPNLKARIKLAIKKEFEIPNAMLFSSDLLQSTTPVFGVGNQTDINRALDTKQLMQDMGEWIDSMPTLCKT